MACRNASRNIASKNLTSSPRGAPRWRHVVDRIRSALADSAWTALAGKAALYLLGAALLAFVGSGRVRWLTGAPDARLSVAVAEASTALPHATAPPVGADAGASPPASADAGTPSPPSPAPVNADAGAPSPGGAVTADGKVILNRATEEDLRRLPGIGPSRAKAILALRERIKGFKRIEDLRRVKGIGRKALARLRPLVVVD